MTDSETVDLSRASTARGRMAALAIPTVFVVLAASLFLAWARADGSLGDSGVDTFGLDGQAALVMGQSVPIEKGRVPFVLMLPLAEAQQRLREAGFRNLTIANRAESAGDRVVDIQPQVGTYADAGQPIRVFLEEGVEESSSS